VCAAFEIVLVRKTCGGVSRKIKTKSYLLDKGGVGARSGEKCHLQTKKQKLFPFAFSFFKNTRESKSSFLFTPPSCSAVLSKEVHVCHLHIQLVSQGVVCVHCGYLGSFLIFRVCFFVIHRGTAGFWKRDLRSKPALQKVEPREIRVNTSCHLINRQNLGTFSCWITTIEEKPTERVS
jgi:hypothetical protein